MTCKQLGLTTVPSYYKHRLLKTISNRLQEQVKSVPAVLIGTIVTMIKVRTVTEVCFWSLGKLLQPLVEITKLKNLTPITKPWPNEWPESQHWFYLTILVSSFVFLLALALTNSYGTNMNRQSILVVFSHFTACSGVCGSLVKHCHGRVGWTSTFDTWHCLLTMH